MAKSYHMSIHFAVVVAADGCFATFPVFAVADPDGWLSLLLEWV
jgi:hypothetical protein